MEKSSFSAFSSPAGSVLEYSIDDGATYQADSVFSDLGGASYVVRVTDVNGCDGFYLAQILFF